MSSVYDELEVVLREVHEGKLEPGRAPAVAGVGKVVVAVLAAGSLEDRVRQIERMLGDELGAEEAS